MVKVGGNENHRKYVKRNTEILRNQREYLEA